MNKVKFQMGAEVELFNTSLVGMVDSESGTIIVRQPKAGADAAGISIGEFIDEIKGVFTGLGLKEMPNFDLPEMVKKATDGINIFLKEIFLLIKTKEPKSVDFAIWISMEVNTDDEPFNSFPVNIKRGYLKIWNTTNPVIQEELDIGVIEKLLGQKTGDAPKTDKPAEEPK